MLISFSGLDGAGKSTIISGLTDHLKSRNTPFVVLTMYDNISFYSLIRNMRDGLKRSLGMKVREKNESNEIAHSGVIPQDPKVDVSDKKNPLLRIFYRIIRSQMLRRVMIPLDIGVLLYRRLQHEIIHKRVLITDRYIYDSLIDVAGLHGEGWGFIHFILSTVTRPNLSVYVDVPAEIAYQRKPEYPLPYVQWREVAYKKLFGLIDGALILNNLEFKSALSTLINTFETRRSK